jgi:putative hemolysin
MFRAKYSFSFDIGNYRIRTIRNVSELLNLLNQRQKIFTDKIFLPTQLELQADHLIAEDIRTHQIVGAYRLSSTEFCLDFESEEDFEVKEWISSTKGNKIELAWAWTHPDFRNGDVIKYLWKGLGHYFKIANAKYAFGPATIYADQGVSISAVYKYLELNHFFTKEHFHLKKTSLLPELPSNISLGRKVLPALLRAYLIAGALICSQPAFDEESNSYDIMTVLDLDQASQPIKDRFI